MSKLHRHIHHAKQRIKHPEIKGIIILGVLTLLIPVLAYVLALPAEKVTVIKQQAAGTACQTAGGSCVANNLCNLNCGKCVSTMGCGSGTTCCDPNPAKTSGPGVPVVVPNPPAQKQAVTQCEANGDVCTPGNLVAQSGGKCTGGGPLGQNPLPFQCNLGYVCCRPNVAFPTSSQQFTHGGNQCGGCSGICSNPGQYCENPLGNNKFGIYLCDQNGGQWQFQYNQTGTNTCANVTPAAGSNNGTPQGTWQCNNSYQCANITTGQIDNTKCTPQCAPPPPTCTCEHDGYGAPLNHFTCKDYTGKEVKSDYCRSNEICDAKTGYPRPCKTPPAPVCTCQNPGSKNLFAIGGWINPQNGYTCTGKNPNQVHYCSQDDACGAYDASNPTQLLPGSGKSNAPQSPCNDKGNIPQATANAVTVQASLIGPVNPYPAIQMTYDFIAQSSLSQSSEKTFASYKTLAAQIIKATDTLKYNSTTQVYENTNFNMDKVPLGKYIVFAKVDGFLAAQVKDFNGNTVFDIAQDKIFAPQKVTLSPGDLAPNPHGDNFVDLNDYNALISCYAKAPTGTCKLADINNDGKIDENDFQILIGNFEKFGDSYTEPNFTCTQDPNCKSGTSSIQLCALKCTKNIDF